MHGPFSPPPDASRDEALRLAFAGWVAAIADRIRNPVAGIGAALEILERRLDEVCGPLPQDDVAAVSLAKIRERLGSLGAYVTELVDFARPAELVHGSFDMARLLAETVREAKQAAPVGAVIELEAPRSVTMLGDAAKLQSSIRALIQNGIEAVGSDHAPRVVVRLAVGDAAAVVSVEDNGPGFAPGLAAQASEPFYSTKEAGTGLGLSIARKYVEAHGGKLALERSESLGGAAVRLEIPSGGR